MQNYVQLPSRVFIVIKREYVLEVLAFCLSLVEKVNLILTSSAIDKKLEIDKKLQKKLEIYNDFKLENKLEIFEFFVN